MIFAPLNSPVISHHSIQGYKLRRCPDHSSVRHRSHSGSGSGRQLSRSVCVTRSIHLCAKKKKEIDRSMAASSKRAVVLLVMVVAAVMVATVRSSAEAARSGGADADELRFPGFPGGRQRSPVVFPGIPRSTSPPAPFGRVKPSPPPAPVAPASPASPAPCSSGTTAPQQPPLPGFPGLQQPGGSSSSPSDCVTPLAGLMTCTQFLTGTEAETPTPQSECCGGLGMFLNSSAAVDDRSLRCLCPVILGDVNRMLPKPIDPVRMMYLPIACGVVLPPQVLFICFTGQPTPPVVSRIPESWMKPSSSSALTP